MPGGISGFALQKVVIVRQLFIPIVFITSCGTITMSVKAMKAGAIDFLPKPFTEKRLLNAIEIAIVKNKVQIKQQKEKAKIEGHINTLSPRELEVFRLVIQGMVNKTNCLKAGIPTFKA